MSGSVWRLPHHPYVPGEGRTPDREALAALRSCLPGGIEGADWRDLTAYRAGCMLYALGYFWEAHEAWEPVWLACGQTSPERHLLGALIQLTNACLKLRMQRAAAARRLVGLAAERLAACRQGCADAAVLGLEPGPLAADIAAFADFLESVPVDAGVEARLARRPRLAIGN